MTDDRPAAPTRAWCEAMDAADPLRRFRDEFIIPDETIYLDGNSLGAMPKAALSRARAVMELEWGKGLIKSWNAAGWFDMPVRLGDKISRLIGADDGEVIACDTTSINLFKVLSTAIALRPDRRTLLLEGSNFPTNNYIAQGVAASTAGRVSVRFLEKEEILAGIDDDTAAACITHVHYKTGHIHDMQAITTRTHEAGALAIWDLCHSAGAMPVSLNRCGVDFAVGCTYKYLNGGPGAPGFLFAARRHHGKAAQPVTGWWGHVAPFDFNRDYTPRRDIRQFLIGTQPIVSMALAETGVDIALRANLSDVRAKAMALTDLLIILVQSHCVDDGFVLASPEAAADRGSQVAFAHPDGYPIMRALIERGVIGDFRAPDILRFGVAPLYTRYVDMWDAVERLVQIMASGGWRNPAFLRREAVT